MKKYFPISIFITLAIVLVGILAIPEYDNLRAQKSDKTSKEFSHYESMLKKFDQKSDEGKNINLSEQNDKILIINFWASWCEPCVHEFPSLIDLRKKIGEDKLTIVTINSDESEDLKKVKKLKDKLGFNFPNIWDENGKLTDAFMIQGIPTSIIYYKGKVVEVSRGSKDFTAEEFLQKINNPDKF